MRTTGKQCGLAATGVYQPSLRSPWLAATETLLGLERGLATNPPDAASLGAPDLGGLWSDPIIGLSG